MGRCCVGTFIGAGAPVASAAQSPRSVAAFREAAAMLQKESVPFSKMLQQSSAPSLSRLQSVSKAEVPFIKSLRHGRGKIVFTGKTKNDIKALIQLDNEEITLLAQVKSVSSFAKGYPPISNKLGQLQIALGKDLGIQPAEV